MSKIRRTFRKVGLFFKKIEHFRFELGVIWTEFERFLDVKLSIKATDEGKSAAINLREKSNNCVIYFVPDLGLISPYNY